MPTMRAFDRTRWPSLAATFLSTAVLCAVIAYWAMIISAPRVAIAPAGSLIDRGAPSDLGPAQRLFGQVAGATPSAAGPSNITVIGIVASARNGSAILVIDGKAPRPVAVGEEIEPGLKLTSVTPTEVILERNGVPMSLPAPPGADIEVLTRGADPSAPSPDAVPPVVQSPAARAPTVTSAPALVPAPSPAAAPGGVPAAQPPAQLNPTGVSKAGAMIERSIKRSRRRGSSSSEDEG